MEEDWASLSFRLFHLHGPRVYPRCRARASRCGGLTICSCDAIEKRERARGSRREKEAPRREREAPGGSEERERLPRREREFDMDIYAPSCASSHLEY
jgi:hypothetical protein